MDIYYAGFIPDEGKISVIFPDVPGCVTWGSNMEEAFARAMDALAGHLEALANDDDPIPSPSDHDHALEGLRQLYVELEDGPLPGAAVLHPVPVPEMDTRTKLVSVSFKQFTLDKIDRKAKAAGMSRSAFLAAAV